MGKTKEEYRKIANQFPLLQWGLEETGNFNEDKNALFSHRADLVKKVQENAQARYQQRQNGGISYEELGQELDLLATQNNIGDEDVVMTKAPKPQRLLRKEEDLKSQTILPHHQNLHQNVHLLNLLNNHKN